MQNVVPPLANNPNNHTGSEILAALRGVAGSRQFSFRYELVDLNDNVVGDLTDRVESCSIDQNWLADIKRTARFVIRDAGGIDFLSDQVRPWIRLHLPPYGEDDWVEWPQGTFLLASPERLAEPSGVVSREIEAYDRLQILIEDKVASRYALPAGANVTTAVSTLLGSLPRAGTVAVPRVNITRGLLALPAAREWEPGTTKLSIVNDLLGAINYESLSFDETGAAIVRPYRAPSTRTEEYVYADDAVGLIVPNVKQGADLFTIANKWVLVVSEPDRPPLVASFTNSDPGSPTSTVRRGRTIVDFRTEIEAVNQGTLDAKVARLAEEASQVYESVEFTTALMPIHSGNDVYRIRYAPLAINARYSEHTWSMNLAPGATMTHRARRLVQL